MAHPQYRHILRRAEGAEAVVLPAGHHDRMGCFIDQVKLSPALLHDLDEAVKKVKLLGEHEEELSQKITELEALCKKLREDTQRLEEEKATLEGMVESHDELITEITRETGLDHMGEDTEDEEEDEDADDGEDATALPVTMPSATTPEEAVKEEDPVEMIPMKEAPVPHEVIFADAEPEMPQPHLYHALMIGYEESPPRMMEDLDDLDEDLNEGRSDMDEWFPKDGNNDRD
jgi:hypothetical protein